MMTKTGRVIATGMVMRQQVMWEVDYDDLEHGAHEVVAELYQTARGWQWETDRDVRIYPAYADGMIGEDRDGHTRIFASRDEALAACIEALSQRIAKAQAAIARLTGKEAR